jgi:hypothetical protein
MNGKIRFCKLDPSRSLFENFNMLRYGLLILMFDHVYLVHYSLHLTGRPSCEEFFNLLG